jgi:hypothetical protein
MLRSDPLPEYDIFRCFLPVVSPAVNVSGTLELGVVDRIVVLVQQRKFGAPDNVKGNLVFPAEDLAKLMVAVFKRLGVWQFYAANIGHASFCALVLVGKSFSLFDKHQVKFLKQATVRAGYGVISWHILL